jgi:hypothetical protein
MNPSERDDRTGSDRDDDSPQSAGEESLEFESDTDRFRANFYQGMIVFFDRVRGRGTIRSGSGREISFEFPFVSVVGAALGGRFPGIDRLREGDTVGFDVGWTSKGLRVTKIKPTS